MKRTFSADTSVPKTSVLKNGAIVGAAGGVAEILFVVLYSAMGGTSAAAVARGVTAAALPSMTASPWAVATGVAVHMGIAIVLGVALVAALRTLRFQPGSTSESAAAVLVLAGVWVLNFFVLLPQIDPSFVRLMPYEATLASKLLFGVAAAVSLRLTGPSSMGRPERDAGYSSAGAAFSP